MRRKRKTVFDGRLYDDLSFFLPFIFVIAEWIPFACLQFYTYTFSLDFRTNLYYAEYKVLMFNEI